MDLGIPMKVEIQSVSSTAIFLTDRLGAGPRTKHIDARYFGIHEGVQDGDFSIKKVPTAKFCADVGMTRSPLQHYKCVASLLDWHSTDHGCLSPLQEDGTSVESSRQKTETDNRQNWL